MGEPEQSAVLTPQVVYQV